MEVPNVQPSLHVRLFHSIAKSIAGDPCKFNSCRFQHMHTFVRKLLILLRFRPERRELEPRTQDNICELFTRSQ